MTWGKPPTFWLGGDGTWTDHDKIFTHAVTIYQARLCSTCGMPQHKCEQTSWDIETSICGPEAAVETWRKNNPEPAPGIKVTPIEATIAAEQSAAAATAPDWVKQQMAAQQQ